MLQREVARRSDGCTLFGYQVRDPERYGVGRGRRDRPARLDRGEAGPAEVQHGGHRALLLRQRRRRHRRPDSTPSARGELEITDVNRAYLDQGRARLVDLGRGIAWLDTGTHDCLLEAGQFVQVLEQRQGVRIACLEEIALRMGFIDADPGYWLGEALGKSGYGQYVMEVARAVGRAARPGEVISRSPVGS